MAYIDEDDDPFYDHEDAMRAAAASAVPVAARASQYEAARASALRSSHVVRPTLSRTLSGGRPTATFDEFLSDSSDSDDDDDGSAIQRMQEQADDMEYIDTTFQLDSPNGRAMGNDDSFRMDAPPPEAAARASDRDAQAGDGSGSDSGDGDDDEDEDDNEDEDNSITRPFAGLADSFVDTRRREASQPDALDSSFRLISPNAAAGSVLRASDAHLRLSDDGEHRGEASDASFVLNSPNGGGGYADDNDDSFASDRPSNLDGDYGETLDDSFTGDRPSNLDADYDRTSLDDSFIGDRPSDLDADYDENLNDSFVSDRPSNLDADYDENLNDSFASDRPSNLDADYDENLDDSFTGDRPSNLDADYNKALDDSFVGDRPKTLDAASSEPDSGKVDKTASVNPVVSMVAAAVAAPVALPSVTEPTSHASAADDSAEPPTLSFQMSEGSKSVEEEDTSFSGGRNSADDSFIGGRNSADDSFIGGRNSADDSFIGGRNSADDSFIDGRNSADDSFARGSLDDVHGDADYAMGDEEADSSFRMSSPDADYWDNNDSFAGGSPPGDAHSEAVDNNGSSFVGGNSGFYDASRAFEQDAGDADVYSRESAGSAASFSAASYDNQQSFFVGSVGSEADGLSFMPLASSPAFSDVVMLGDESETGKSHESRSLDLHGLAARASDGSTPGDYSSLAPRDEPPLLPIAIKVGNTSDLRASAVEAPSLGAPSRASSRFSSRDKLPLPDTRQSARLSASPSAARGTFDSIGKAFTFSRDTVSRGTLGDSFMRNSGLSEVDIPLGDSLVDDHAFRLSSPNAQGDGDTGANSFMSESSLGDSFVGDSFASVNYSEVAARHMERRSSETSRRDSEAKNQTVHAGAQASSSPIKSQTLLSSSVEAERQTDEKLDFTGVLRDSVHSHENARISLESRSTIAPLEDKIRDSSLLFTAAPPVATRARGDSVQRASERKVEDFFRRTYNYNKDDADLNFADANRRTRSRTTVEFSVHPEEEEEKAGGKSVMSDAARQRSKSTGTKKTIDLKSLRAGASAVALQASSGAGVTRSRAVSRPSTRLQIKEDLLEVPERRSRLTFRSSGDSGSSLNSMEAQALAKKIQEVEVTRSRQNSAVATDAKPSRVIQRNFTLSISSETRSSEQSRADSPNMIPMPPRYMLSPKVETPMKMSGTSVFAFSKGLSKSKAAAGNDNGNSMTPTLPGLSVASSSLTPSPFSASYAPNSSKLPSTGMAPGFKWNAQEQLQQLEARSDEGGAMSIKESIWHEAGITRLTLSDQVATHFHRFSSSLRNTLQRTGVRFFGQQHRGANANQTTSPQSVCSAPPKLSRKFDDKNFYVRFGRGGGVEDNDEVIAAKQALGRNQTPENVFKKQHARTMVILLCALLGIGLGIGLIHVESLSASFNLPRAQQLALQPVNGGLQIAMATQWILLPGKLFLRLWNCVTMPLLFCHILNGIADLMMNQKAGLALSFRSLGYMLAVSIVTAAEGVGMMAAIKSLGLFNAVAGASTLSTKVAAASLRKTLGVVERLSGTVALMCEADSTYLQVVNEGKSFRCSNESIPLPVREGAAENGTMRANSSAIFVLSDVNSVLKPAATTADTPLSQMRYYPQAQSVGEVSRQFVDSLVPANVADSLIHSTPVSVVTIALLLGIVCGKRAWDRGIKAKHGEFGDSRIELAGEHVADKPHYILGVFVELQLALEWLVDALETLAPIGVLSLLAGNIVLHRTELMTIVHPMMQLVLSVVLVLLLHMLLVAPVLMKLCFGANVFKALGAFLPAYLICFCTGSVVLSLPTVQRCYERANVVTKSMAQVSMGMLSVLHRNAHALYFPVALLWLLQTSSPAGDVELTPKLCLLIGALAAASCFLAPHPVASVVSGAHGGSNLLLLATLWRAVLAYSGSLTATLAPPTLPLLVACDVLLSRAVAVANLHDNLVLTRIVAEHCDEAVVHGPGLDGAAGGAPIGLASSPMFL